MRDGKRFIAYGETVMWPPRCENCRATSAPIFSRGTPRKAAALAEKLFSLDQVIFERADDSDGYIGDELRAACVLWLDAAAALRANKADSGHGLAARVYELYRRMTTGFASRYSSKRIDCFERMSCGPWRVASRTTHDER